MESTDSSSGSQLQLPPGFRFHPTDEELVVHYLKRKAASAPLPVTIIAEVDLYKFDPWELPGKANFGEQEWYFFSPRERKYPNGARPNRAATSGYWKATGTDKPILSSGGTSSSQKKVGVKKALVFYGGKPPKGIKTNWIMHEYRLAEPHNTTCRPPQHASSTHDSNKASRRLDDWVLCRIYKKNNHCTQRPQMERESGDSMDNMLSVSSATAPMPINPPTRLQPHQHHRSATATNYSSALLDNDGTFFQGFLTTDTDHQEDGSQSTHAADSMTTAIISAAAAGGSSSMRSTKPDQLCLAAPTFQAKHALTSSSPNYWCDAAGSNINQPPLPLRRFQPYNGGAAADDDGGGGGHMIETLLHQIPQQSSTTAANYIHRSVLGSVELQGDGSTTSECVFRQVPYQLLSSMNWRTSS